MKTCLFLLLAIRFITNPVLADDLRLGIIGCDTSHATAFTELLNDPQAKNHVPGARVVAAFPGGSKDIQSSWSRVEEYTKTLQNKYHVRIYEDLEQMCRDVDAILLESVDGRPHLEQARAVFKAGKPLFIDKPMAGSLKDVEQIFHEAARSRVPLFSSSALRFGHDTQAAHHGSLGKISYAETSGPCELEPHHPDLFWYGVHGVEALYTVLGPGCQTVQRGTNAQGKIEVTGTWSGGRKGVFREDKGFHGLAKGDQGEAQVGSFDGYAPLVEQIVRFFQTRVEPVPREETIEIFAFMEAADLSKEKNGEPVRLSDLLHPQPQQK